MSTNINKIKDLSTEQKQKLLAKLRDKKLGGLGQLKEEKKIDNNFKQGENFAYKFNLPPNFLKTEFAKIGIEDPAPDMVQVEAKAASLNFRDLMIAMGMYPPTPGIPSVMGSDYAGVVSKVGENVTRYKPGDKVMLLSAGSLLIDNSIDPKSHFCKYMNVHHNQVFPMPESASFTDAACIPTVYITSYFSLINSARIQKDETVLIHSATGGVGLSAIEICKWKGCKIFATAGNAEKRELLKKKGASLVMDSRNTSFEKEILEYTNGKGVDVVLNTLSGDMMKAGINVLDFFGRFLQIDKKDIAMNNSIELSNFEKGLSFTAVDIGLLTRDYNTINRIFIELNELIDQGEIKPIQSTVYSYKKLGEALNYMSKSAHIGKLVIEFN